MIWFCLFGAAILCCVAFCYRSIKYYLSFPTKTEIFTKPMGIQTPDVTVCNHLGFDRTVLRKIDEISFQYMVKTGGREQIDLSEKYSFPGLFGNALGVSMSKYQLFQAKYQNNDELNLSFSEMKEMQNLKDLFGKRMMIGHMSKEEILDGGIPEWQLLMWCKYGRYLRYYLSNIYIITSNIGQLQGPIIYVNHPAGTSIV